MPSLPHEVAIAALRDQPLLLNALLAHTVGVRNLGPLRHLPSTIQAAKAKVVIPDLAFKTRGAWLLVEVQRKIDPDKRSMSLLAMALLYRQTRRMGNLVFITQSRAMARWCKRIDIESTEGTRIRMEPIVVLLDERAAERLLDTKRPELGVFAAWAIHTRTGPRAKRIALRALDLTESLPPTLREEEQSAIFNVLSPELVKGIKEELMKTVIKDSPSARSLRKFIQEMAKRQVQAEMLLQMLKLKGFTLSKAQEKRVVTCQDPAELNSWTKRILTATTLKDVLG